MVLTVIGTGFVGVVTSAVFADAGHNVYGLDIDAAKISSLKDGTVPFYEPQLDALLEKSVASGKLVFTTDYREAISDADVIMIAVGTPSKDDGSVNLSYVISAAESLAPHIKDGVVIGIKSTVPPGTHDVIEDVIGKDTSKRYSVAAVPEFLREGSAVFDTLNPSRVVFGISDQWAADRLMELHEFLPGKRYVVKRESASLGKYASNAYLATRITFANQVANICEHTGASISEVLDIVGADERIGSHYWYPGLGYGGSCFPKDVQELSNQAKALGLTQHLTSYIHELNSSRIEEKMKAFSEFAGGFEDKRVALLGLSFKPNTNDMREAPSTYVAPYLVKAGASVVGYDPQAMTEAKELIDSIEFGSTLVETISGADIIMLLVEWDELVKLSPGEILKHAPEALIIDTRNQYDAQDFMEKGIQILQIGNG